ncbi:MAG: YbjN domain-containing protein [Candidatus Ranarchaeia archaeon]
MSDHNAVDQWLKQIGVEYEKEVDDAQDTYTWRFKWGSAVIYCRLFGIEPTRNLFAWSTILDDVNKIDPSKLLAFYKYLLTLNSKSWNYVKFALTEAGEVQLRWGILFRHLDHKDEFVLGMTQIAKTADKYDDELKKYCKSSG